MNPEIGQKVIVYFRNGACINGIVVSWTDQKSAIRSDTTTTIIQKTIEDVLFVKITMSNEEREILIEKPNKQLDDLKQLAELKNEANELDRIDLREKVSSHQPDGNRVVNYGLPLSNIKIEGALEHSRAKTSRPSVEFGAELQDLFNKKS